ncbi:MAG: sn-glycerol-1-phosphate dehydrogenase [Phycisphaerae bacterium]|nr:sn-glycerol-1-phosphate dehydrogenase [Phycisphaerae bacterium]
MTTRIPETVQALAGWRFTSASGQQHSVSTRRVILERGAIEKLPGAIEELGLGRRAWILADENTFAAAGEQTRRVLEAAGIEVRQSILRAHDGYIGADDIYLDQAREGVWEEAELFVGVGSGVINDLTRLLVLERGVRYAAVATAASVNGYGSPISSFIEKGVKIIKPSARTDVIVADLDVLTAAPVRLSQSGFGDLLAKNTSNTDWYLAHLVTGTGYTPIPVEMVRRAGQRAIRLASGVGRRDPESIEVLIAGLIAGAFAMDSAGVTAPASGGEHLISHYMEMVAHFRNYQPPMHGEQVALGTLIASSLYERLLEADLDGLDVDGLVERYPEWPQRSEQVRCDHGELAEIVMPEARKQQKTKAQYRAHLETIRRAWPQFVQQARDSVLPAGTIREAYEAAGTPTRASQLEIDPALVRKAYLLARDVRDRYTVLHLAGDLGLLASLADEVLDRSGVLR